jgi:predicted transcriptional regulator
LQIGLNDAVRVQRLRHLAQRSRREPGHLISPAIASRASQRPDSREKIFVERNPNIESLTSIFHQQQKPRLRS